MDLAAEVGNEFAHVLSWAFSNVWFRALVMFVTPASGSLKCSSHDRIKIIKDMCDNRFDDFLILCRHPNALMRSTNVTDELVWYKWIESYQLTFEWKTFELVTSNPSCLTLTFVASLSTSDILYLLNENEGFISRYIDVWNKFSIQKNLHMYKCLLNAVWKSANSSLTSAGSIDLQNPVINCSNLLKYIVFKKVCKLFFKFKFKISSNETRIACLCAFIWIRICEGDKILSSVFLLGLFGSSGVNSQAGLKKVLHEEIGEFEAYNQLLKINVNNSNVEKEFDKFLIVFKRMLEQTKGDDQDLVSLFNKFGSQSLETIC